VGKIAGKLYLLRCIRSQSKKVQRNGEICGLHSSASALSLPRERQIHVGANELFGQQDDLSLMQLQVADNPIDGFEDGHRPPIPGGLRVDHFQQTRGRKRPDYLSALCEGFGKAPTNLIASLGRRQRKLRVPLTHIRLAVDAVQKPLPQIALKVKKKIGNGIFVVPSTTPYLLIGQLIETSIDVVLGELHPLH
jgi:hypothetical protein